VRHPASVDLRRHFRIRKLPLLICRPALPEDDRLLPFPPFSHPDSALLFLSMDARKSSLPADVSHVSETYEPRTHRDRSRFALARRSHNKMPFDSLSISLAPLSARSLSHTLPPFFRPSRLAVRRSPFAVRNAFRSRIHRDFQRRRESSVVVITHAVRRRHSALAVKFFV
jgi:hypothetical protein